MSKKRPAGRLPGNPQARNVTLCGRFSKDEAKEVNDYTRDTCEVRSAAIRKLVLNGIRMQRRGFT